MLDRLPGLFTIPSKFGAFRILDAPAVGATGRGVRHVEQSPGTRRGLVLMARARRLDSIDAARALR